MVLFMLVFLKNNFIYLLALLGLCGMWTFSTCGKWELLCVAVHGLLIAVASLVEHEHEDTRASVVWYTSLAAPWHVEFSQSRDGTCVSCTGRQIL